MEFKKLIWYVEEKSSYIQIEIEWWDNNNSIGDQVWFSNDWKIMEILKDTDESILEEVKNMFTWNSKRAFVWAMMRMWDNNL